MAKNYSSKRRVRKYNGGGVADTATLMKGGSCGSAAGCGVAIFGAAGQQHNIPGDSTIATNPVNMVGGDARGGKGLGAVMVPAGLFVADRMVHNKSKRRGSRRYRRKSYRRRR